MEVTGDTKFPLEGVVVADFTRILAGPIATMTLADMGAAVIKIERPESGDETRTWGPPFLGEDATYFHSVNRNKKSIVLDLKNPDDLTTAREIIDRADVVVENFRPGVMDGLGLGYETVRSTNPGVVYCSMPAFLAEDMSRVPGNDLMMQAITGFMSITGEDERPAKMGVALLDIVAGLNAVGAIAAALVKRGREGSGTRIEVGLFESSVAALANQASNYLLGGVVPGRFGTAHPNIVPYQAFEASDGGFVLAAAGNHQFVAVCGAIGRRDLADDPRFKTNASRIENRDVLVTELASTFATNEVDHWVGVLLEVGVPAGRIRTIDEVFASEEGRTLVESVSDPDGGETKLVKSPLRFDGANVGPTAPPRLGQDEAEIRAWISGNTPTSTDSPR